MISESVDQRSELLRCGLDARDRGDQRTAEAALQAVLEQDPAHEPALLPLVELLAGQNRLAEAERWLGRAVAAAPEAAAPLTLLGVLALRGGNAELGLGCLVRVTEQTPGDAAAWLRLGEARQQQGQWPEAAEALARAAQLAPDEVGIHTRLAAVRGALGDPEAARAALEAALVLTSSDPELCGAVAETTLALGDDPAAERALRRIEALQPTRLSSLLIEITTHCNLKCPGCLRTIRTDEGSWSNRHIGLEEYRRLIAAAPVADELIPQGVGEPTLHPDLPELIRIARESGKFGSIAFTTNALARGVEYFGRLFEAGLTYLNISVDSLDPDLAAELRTGTIADKLRERVRELAARFPVVIFVTVGRRNREQLPQLLAELAALRPWRVNLHPFDDMGRPENVLSAADKAALSAEFPALAARFPSLPCELHGFGPQSGACPVLWNSPAVTVDGALTPCCRILDSQVFSFGNVLERPFTEIWCSATRARWMAEFKQRRPAVCRGCDWYPEPEADHD